MSRAVQPRLKVDQDPAIQGPRTLGRVIKYHRTSRKFWTQKELARRAEISVIYLRKIEHDRNIPSEGVIRRLAVALGLPKDELLEIAGYTGPFRLDEGQGRPIHAKAPDLPQLYAAAFNVVICELLNHHWPWVDGTRLVNLVVGVREEPTPVLLGPEGQWHPAAVLGFDLPGASARRRHARTEDARAQWARHGLGYLELDPDLCLSSDGYVMSQIEAYFEIEVPPADNGVDLPADEGSNRHPSEADLRLV